MASTSKPSVVLLGLPYNHSKVPEHLRDFVRQTLGALDGQFETAGLPFEFVAVAPEDDLATLRDKLQQRQPDAIVVGNGIRSSMDLTFFMEQLISTAQATVPQAKILFNTMPDTTLDAVKRWYPVQ